MSVTDARELPPKRTPLVGCLTDTNISNTNTIISSNITTSYNKSNTNIIL